MGKEALENRTHTEIIIVRHGETDWNALRKVQGQLDVDLNEVGRQQAAALAERLSKEHEVSAIYSSDLKRALNTAEMIATRCGGLEVIKDLALRERHMGDLQGLTFQDFANLNPKAYEAFKSTDLEVPGGGESRVQLYKRCTSSLQRIAKEHKGQQVVVVTHGAVMEALYKWTTAGGQPEGISNASVGIIQGDGGDEGWSIKTWNDISHLAEVGFLKSAFGGDGSSA